MEPNPKRFRFPSSQEEYRRDDRRDERHEDGRRPGTGPCDGWHGFSGVKETTKHTISTEATK